MTSLRNQLRRLDERARVAELEQVYGRVLGIRDGYRTMPTVSRVMRLQALYNRGNPRTNRRRGPGWTRKPRKGRLNYAG